MNGSPDSHREGRVVMVPSFDIFSGRHGSKDAHWVESAKGLGNAYMRMKELGPRIAAATSYSVLRPIEPSLISTRPFLKKTHNGLALIKCNRAQLRSVGR